MKDDNIYDVVIIGAGPIGLTLACLLAQLKINILLVEKNEEINHNIRAVSVDNLVLKTWDSCGLLEKMKPYLYIYEKDSVILEYFESTNSLLRFTESAEILNEKRIVNIIQYEIERILLEELSRHSCVSVSMGTSFENFSMVEDKVILEVHKADGTTQNITSLYLVGCDGGKSRVRELIGCQLQGHTLKNQWLIINCIQKCLKDRESIKVNCHYKQPWASIPMAKGYKRFEFMLPEKAPKELSDYEVVSLIQSQRNDITIDEIIEKKIQSFHFRISQSFSDLSLKVFLAGDAAHLIAPFTGKGISLGVSDARNLSQKLKYIFEKSDMLDSQEKAKIMASYEKEQKRIVKKVFFITRFMHRIMTPKNYLTMKIQNLFLKAISLNKIIKRRVYFR